MLDILKSRVVLVDCGKNESAANELKKNQWTAN